MRARGTALIAALATLVICMLLLTASIKLVSQQRSSWLARRDTLVARASAESGLALAMARLNANNRPDVLRKLNGHEGTPAAGQRFTLVTANRLGYPWVQATGYAGERQYRIAAYLGAAAYPLASYGLVVRESAGPMFASGDCLIEGGAKIPGGSITPKGFEKIPAAQLPLVKGPLYRSDKNGHPDIQPWVAQQAQQFIMAANGVTVGLGNPPKQGVWSLAGKTWKFPANLKVPAEVTRIEGPGTLLVRGDLTLTGPIVLGGDAVLACSGSLLAEQEVQLAATVFTGVRIVLPDLKGVGVLVTRGSCDLGPVLDLKAPSIAGLIQVPALGPGAGQRLSLRGGTFAGTLFSWGEEDWHTPLLKVNGGTRFRGYIYSSGKVEINAPLEGHVFTHTLLATSGSRVFTNWLKDLRIKRAPETVCWALPPGFNKTIDIVEWERR